MFRLNHPDMPSLLTRSLSRLQSSRLELFTRSQRLSGCVGIALFAAAGASAQEGVGRPQITPLQERCISLGSAGLLAEFSSYGTYGAVQNRQGQSRAAIEASHRPGMPATGYSDNSSQLIVPVDLLAPLGASSRAFVKVGASANLNRGQRRITDVDTSTFRTEAEFLWSPTPAGLVGVGAFVEDISVDMRHNGSQLDDRGHGLRADFLRRLDRHWGVAARAEYTWTDRKLRSPLPGGRVFACDQEVGRFYSQVDLVGTYTKEDWGWVPSGWLVRPSLGAAYQRNRFETAISNLGSLVTGTVGPHDSYLSASGAVRLERAVRGRSLFSPFVELGYERELVNDLDAKVDDPDILHTAVGFSSNLGRRLRADVEYNRYDGFHGQRRAQSLTVHLGLVF